MTEATTFRPSTCLFYCGPVVYENGSDGTPTWHFFATDHLGNVRVVSDVWGRAEQINHYYPYGLTFADAGKGAGVQPCKHGGKELDAMYGLYWSDFGARHLSHQAACWTTMDPLCEKYYHLSPYLYCANNPFNLIDPDGRKVIKDRYSIQFNSNWAAARKYLGEFYKTLYNVIDASPHNVYVYDGATNGMGNKTRVKEKTISLNNGNETKEYTIEINVDMSVAFELEDGNIMSTAMGLLHELGHAASACENPQNYNDRVNAKNEIYDNEEEKRNITEVETPAAEALGEPKRSNHRLKQTVDNHQDPTWSFKKDENQF